MRTAEPRSVLQRLGSRETPGRTRATASCVSGGGSRLLEVFSDAGTYLLRIELLPQGG